MRLAAAAALLGALVPTGAEGSLELTEADFDEQVYKSGKFAFVKFLAPWWGHCKKLKPDWDRLADAYNKPDSRAVIADVDCTQDNAKNLCSKHGVEGYPTIKYYSKDTSDIGEKYEGDREYNKLKKFVNKMSKPPCVIATLENCNKKEKTFIEEIKGWDAAKVETEKASFQAQLDEASKKHKDLADLFETQKDTAIATMKRAEEAKTALEKTTKSAKYKTIILDQKASDGKQDEL